MITPAIENTKLTGGLSWFNKLFKRELRIPLLPKNIIKERATIIAGTQRGTLDRAIKNFLPRKFFLAQK